MGLNLVVPGDVEGLRTLGTWLDNDLAKPTSYTDLDLAYAWSDSSNYWTGQAGDAFRTAAMEIRNRSSDLPKLLNDIASALRAYATRLERAQGDFAEYLLQAKSAGLSVAGTVVKTPTTSLQYCPADNAPEADIEEYDRYLGRIETYNQLQGIYGTWIGEMDTWISENLVPLSVRTGEFSELGSLLAALAMDNEDIIEYTQGLVLDYADEHAETLLVNYQLDANGMQADLDEIRAGQRSGNPALRAAADAANPSEIRAGLRALNETIEGVSRVSKFIPVLGGVATVVDVGVELAEGGSPSSIGVELLAGGAAASAATAYAASWSVPPVAAVATVALVAVGAGAGARWLYESQVPIDVRESIDGFLVGYGQPVLLSGAQPTWVARR